jgi:tRNA (cmo5U34)-methyltransferase
MEQLTWLAESGFTDIDVLWKYYNFAVYGGRKSSVSRSPGTSIS